MSRLDFERSFLGYILFGFLKVIGISVFLFMEADRILEINPDNRIWTVLRTAWASDHDRVKEIAEVLYDQALLIEEFPISDRLPVPRRWPVFWLPDLNHSLISTIRIPLCP